MKPPYYFLGAGGIGMSALAHILLEQGEEVVGTDLKDIAHLEPFGLKSVDQIPAEGTMVYSSAISSCHSCLVEARRTGYPLLHRSELLQRLLIGKKGLLVAGTHGKTTTAALLAWVLYVAEKDPTFAVGGILRNFNKNGAHGKGEHFVVEADESDGSFLNYSGTGLIVTGIESDHLDYWQKEERLVQGFQRVMAKPWDPQLFFWCSDDPKLRLLAPHGISYGKTGELKLLALDQQGAMLAFSAAFRGAVYRDIQLPLMGEALALNALAVFGMALALGIDEARIRRAFMTFKGVKRRQEKIGEAAHIAIYDDYAHHPTAIRMLLKGVKQGLGQRRLVAVFQPHRFTRTRDLFAEFASAFKEPDLTIITDIYCAGESPISGVSGQQLARAMQTAALFIAQGDLLFYLPKLLIPGDVLVLIGAGDITYYGPQLLQSLQ